MADYKHYNNYSEQDKESLVIEKLDQVKTAIDNMSGGGDGKEPYYVAPSDEILAAYMGESSQDFVYDDAPKFFNDEGVEVNGSQVAQKILAGEAKLDIKKDMSGVELFMSCPEVMTVKAGEASSIMYTLHRVSRGVLGELFIGYSADQAWSCTFMGYGGLTNSIMTS